MRSSSDSSFAMLFFVLAAFASSLLVLAPSRPEVWFVGTVLGIVVATQLVLISAKLSQPKPVNWLTVDVLFSASYSVINFAYFVYWIFGLLGDRPEIWYLRRAHVPEHVCACLAMYAACLNVFLLGYYLLPTRKIRPIINELRPPRGLSIVWGNFGRMMIRLGFLGFLAFVLIIGPARFFGVYSGTNNISFVANIFFQLGQVFVTIGIAIALSAHQRVLNRAHRKNKLGIGFFDKLLIFTALVAVGLHGDRSTLLYLLLPGMIAYSEYVRPIRATTLIVSGTVLVFFLGLIVTFRSGRMDRYEFAPIENINNALVNLGTSSVCGFVAADYVPSQHDYYYGIMQVRQLAGIIPFGRRLMGITDSTENSSSMLLTELIQGRVGQGVAGTGTSVFADFYFDFGFWGTAFLFGLIGMMAKHVQNRARMSTSLLWQVGFVALVTFLALCSRYSLVGGLIRFVIYAVLYTVFFSLIMGVPTAYSINRNQQPGRPRKPLLRSPSPAPPVS